MRWPGPILRARPTKVRPLATLRGAHGAHQPRRGRHFGARTERHGGLPLYALYDAPGARRLAVGRKTFFYSAAFGTDIGLSPLAPAAGFLPSRAGLGRFLAGRLAPPFCAAATSSASDD